MEVGKVHPVRHVDEEQRSFIRELHRETEMRKHDLGADVRRVLAGEVAPGFVQRFQAAAVDQHARDGYGPTTPST